MEPGRLTTVTWLPRASSLGSAAARTGCSAGRPAAGDAGEQLAGVGVGLASQLYCFRAARALADHIAEMTPRVIPRALMSASTGRASLRHASFAQGASGRQANSPAH